MMRFCYTLMMVLAASDLAGGSSILLEVEDFEGTWTRQTNISGFLGKGFVTSNANPAIADTAMEGVAEIAATGTYAVWVRGYSSDNSNRAFRVQVADSTFAPTHGGAETGWSWLKAGEVPLSAGTVPIRVHDAADGFESADAIWLTSDLNTDPEAELAESRRWLAYPDGLPENADPLRFNIEACRKALSAHTVPVEAAAWQARAPQVKAALQARLGLDPWPEKTPLNAQVTGRAERDFYTVENVVFESRPKFYVTANLYLPKSATLPAPAVVVVPGHAMDDGKNYNLYQLGQLGMVKEGIIVLAYDPIGQGERKRPGFDHKLGYGSLLVGQTNEGYIVWDTIRALDYLATRPEVDVARLGLAGNSGGGENTFYTMPLEERFQVGASFSFVCTYDLWIAEGGNHCICNHLPGIVHEMEEFEIIGLNAPRPFLAGNGSEDKIFPVAGFNQSMQQASQLYAMAGAADRIKGVLAPAPHGWSQPLREAGRGWMKQWLIGAGDGSPVAEEGVAAEDPKSMDLQCFKDGQMPADAETVVTLNRKRADTFFAQYDTLPESADAWNSRAPRWREEIWEVLGGRPADFAPVARTVAEFEWEGTQVEVLSIATEPGMEVAAIFAKPLGSMVGQPATVFVGGHEVKRLAITSGYAREALQQGPVLVLDPRGTGESFRHENHLTSDTVLLGRPLFAQQVWDLLQAGRYLAGRDDVDSARISVHGVKDGALLGLYAAALDGVFSAVAAGEVLASYRYYLEDEQPQSIGLCVPNILSVADIPHVAALAAPVPVQIAGAVGFETGSISASEAFGYTGVVYTLAAPGQLHLVP